VRAGATMWLRMASIAARARTPRAGKGSRRWRRPRPSSPHDSLPRLVGERHEEVSRIGRPPRVMVQTSWKSGKVKIAGEGG